MPRAQFWNAFEDNAPTGPNVLNNNVGEAHGAPTPTAILVLHIGTSSVVEVAIPSSHYPRAALPTDGAAYASDSDGEGAAFTGGVSAEGAGGNCGAWQNGFTTHRRDVMLPNDTNESSLQLLVDLLKSLSFSAEATLSLCLEAPQSSLEALLLAQDYLPAPAKEIVDNLRCALCAPEMKYQLSDLCPLLPLLRVFLPVRLAVSHAANAELRIHLSQPLNLPIAAALVHEGQILFDDAVLPTAEVSFCLRMALDRNFFDVALMAAFMWVSCNPTARLHSRGFFDVVGLVRDCCPDSAWRMAGECVWHFLTVLHVAMQSKELFQAICRYEGAAAPHSQSQHGHSSLTHPSSMFCGATAAMSSANTQQGTDSAWRYPTQSSQPRFYFTQSQQFNGFTQPSQPPTPSHAPSHAPNHHISNRG